MEHQNPTNQVQEEITFLKESLTEVKSQVENLKEKVGYFLPLHKISLEEIKEK